jgi:hypothetical protein
MLDIIMMPLITTYNEHPQCPHHNVCQHKPQGTSAMAFRKLSKIIL